MTLVVTLTVLGCPASERDLSGTWQITDGSREYLPEEYREAAGRLTLAADGTFSAFELPVFRGLDYSHVDPRLAEPKPALLTGSGTWKLGRSGDQTVRLWIEAGSKDYPGTLPFGYLLFVRRFLDYSLVDYWGDPDAVPGIFYSRTQASAEDVRREGS